MLEALPNWHPLLVHLPIGCFSMALVCDFVIVARVREIWLDRAVVSAYAFAAVSSLAAALTGKLAANGFEGTLVDEASVAMAEHGDWAFFAVVAMVATFAIRFDAHWRDRGESRVRLSRVRYAGVGVACVAGLVMAGTAARGGELVYGYGIGVAARSGTDEGS